MTFANSGDNISVYVPMFANMGITELCVTLIVFMGMMSLWSLLTYSLLKIPVIMGWFLYLNICWYMSLFVFVLSFIMFQIIAHTLVNYGKYIIPLLLLVLGFTILDNSNSFSLLSQFL